MTRGLADAIRAGLAHAIRRARPSAPADDPDLGQRLEGRYGPLTVQKVSVTLPIAAELLRPPTEAELAAAAEQHATDLAHQRVEQQRYAELVAAADGLLAAVLRLHAPVAVAGSQNEPWVECQGCEVAGRDAEQPGWPCATARQVFDEAGPTSHSLYIT
ncbi:MAG TPA: hypothetical protein VGD67_26775 [Pseudonocardiaceae bacterium]